MVVQWLRLCLPMQRVRVQFLVVKLRCHMPMGKTKQNKTRNRSNVVKKSIKTLKMVHICLKIFFKKE